MRRTLSTLTMAGGAALLFLAGSADVLRLSESFGRGTASARFGPAQWAGCLLGGALCVTGWWSHRRSPALPAPPTPVHEPAPGA
jgi:hypothetical protein